MPNPVRTTCPIPHSHIILVSGSNSPQVLPKYLSVNSWITPDCLNSSNCRLKISGIQNERYTFAYTSANVTGIYSNISLSRKRRVRKKSHLTTRLESLLLILDSDWRADIIAPSPTRIIDTCKQWASAECESVSRSAEPDGNGARLTVVLHGRVVQIGAVPNQRQFALHG